MRTSAQIDRSDKKSVQAYENVLRQRLKRLGYRLSKRRTIRPKSRFIELIQMPESKGFRVVDIASSSVISGKNYDVSLDDLERFWVKEYERWCIGQQELKQQKWQARMATKKKIESHSKW